MVYWLAVVSVVYWVSLVVGSIPTSLHIIFFLSNRRDLHYFQLEILSKCDIKAENISTLCKFQEGRKGLRPMASNANHLDEANFKKIYGVS